jgi:glutathione S-transferase
LKARNTAGSARFIRRRRRLDGREWIACAKFAVADILLASVLREIRKTDLMASYPRLKDFYARALAPPAWERTLKLYAERLGVPVAEIR